MYEVSQTFLDYTHRSHEMDMKVEIYVDGNLERTLAGSTNLITDGNVRMDDVALQTSMDITVTDPDTELIPSDNRTDNLLEAGYTQMRAYRGIVIAGATHWVPFPTTVVDDLRIDDSGAGLQMVVSCVDQAVKISRDRFRGTYWIPDGTVADVAILDLLRSRMPGVQFVYEGEPNWTLNNRIYQPGDDPWETAFNIAHSIGCELYFTEDLTPTVKCTPIPLQADSPVDSFFEGDEANLLYVNKIRNMSGVVNRCVVLSEASKQNVVYRGIAEDLNPASLTYVPRFGACTNTTVMSSVKTATQCQKAADRRLRKLLGKPERVEFQNIVNPALRLNDVVELVRGASGVNSLYFIDKITFPLTHNRAMNTSGRERRLLVA
jgi:hypothetical protein